MMNKTLRSVSRASMLPLLALGAAQANAAAIDVAAVVTDIAAQAVPIGLIGAAVLLIFVAIKGFKWVRRAF